MTTLFVLVVILWDDAIDGVRRRWRDDTGGLTGEYVAIIVMVGLVLLAVGKSTLGQRISNAISAAISNVSRAS